MTPNFERINVDLQNRQSESVREKAWNLKKGRETERSTQNLLGVAQSILDFDDWYTLGIDCDFAP